MKKIILSSLILILSVVLVACGNNDNSNNNEDKEMVTVTHELGETDVPVNPEKVIVFDFGILDTLDKLDIDVAAVPQVNIPSYLEKYEGDEYENVGSLKEPDFEKIAEIDPDLIIISGRQSDLYDQLSELSPVTYLGVDTSRYMDSFEENTRIVGDIFEKEDEVEEELEAIQSSIDGLKEKAAEADKNGLIVLANNDKISAYGPSSRFGIIHDVFGINPADDKIEVSTHGQNVTFEYVAETNPDMLFVIDRSAAIGEGEVAKQIVENKLTERTNAYKDDKIIYLDPDFWYLSGGGLISVSEMVKEIEPVFE